MKCRMPFFTGRIFGARKCSKVSLLLLLILGGQKLLVIDPSVRQWHSTNVESHGWDIGRILRVPDTLLLRSLDVIRESIKILFFGGTPSQPAKDIQWLYEAKDEICDTFGIDTSVELRILDDHRMLAQAGPPGRPGRGQSWVLLSKGVLETLPPKEVVAVLAHELTHVARCHHLKRGFLILDFYRLMLLWSLKQKEDSMKHDLETIAATMTMWLILGLKSRAQEMEADRHMLDIVRPGTAFYALARMHYPLDDPGEVLEDAKEVLQILGLEKTPKRRSF